MQLSFPDGQTQDCGSPASGGRWLAWGQERTVRTSGGPWGSRSFHVRVTQLTLCPMPRSVAALVTAIGHRPVSLASQDCPSH